MEFKDKLKKLRTEAGVSQEALAEAIHVSRSAIAKYENGNGNPSNETLKALAFYFGVDVSEFKDQPMMKKTIMPSLLSSLIIISLTVPLMVFFLVITISTLIYSQTAMTSFPWWGLIPLIIILLILIVPACFIAINEIKFLRNKEINKAQIVKLNNKIFWSSVCCIYLYSVYFITNLVLFLMKERVMLYIFGASHVYEFFIAVLLVLISLLYPILHCVKFNKKI